jgi:hypothetical protein
VGCIVPTTIVFRPTSKGGYRISKRPGSTRNGSRQLKTIKGLLLEALQLDPPRAAHLIARDLGRSRAEVESLLALEPEAATSCRSGGNFSGDIFASGEAML